ncbi:MAG: recombination mediator RecR [Synergistaceae bacterium]|nr:recombination mediator RecR [Synergistaceae bacterium]
MSLPDSFEELIGLLGHFPGVGEKTARRMVFFMLSSDRSWVDALAHSIGELRERVASCEVCGAIATGPLCGTCSDRTRDRTQICVVETQEDCVAMEQSGVFGGVYHVLGGRCSPLEDEEVPSESLERLRMRIRENGTAEVILALNPRIEGDMTAYVVQEALAGMAVKITRLSYGLPVGGSIGYADRVTLHIALESRREMEVDKEEGR